MPSGPAYFYGPKPPPLWPWLPQALARSGAASPEHWRGLCMNAWAQGLQGQKAGAGGPGLLLCRSCWGKWNISILAAILG